LDKFTLFLISMGVFVMSQQEPTPEGARLFRLKENLKHFAIILILVVGLTFLLDFLIQRAGLLPVAASTQAAPIDRLFTMHFKLIAFLFSLIFVFVVYSLVVFRARPNDPREGMYFKASTGLETVWMLIPLGAVLYISYLGSLALAETRRVDPNALEVKVIGGQWFWSFEYPEYGIKSSTLNLPVNRQVLLKLTSVDVIHSFWVPEFRVKQDVLPGDNLVRELRVTPTELGTFKVRCAELCGTSHAYMESPVVVMTQADFDAWLTEQSAVLQADPVTRGQFYAQTNGCFSCHSVDGKPNVGPTWKGLFGKQQTLMDGTSVTVDEVYLQTAILQPAAQVAQGNLPNVMPATYETLLTEEQVADIIEFIKSLKE
jgi:cytochrome c oxidase subunit 2